MLAARYTMIASSAAPRPAPQRPRRARGTRAAGVPVTLRLPGPPAPHWQQPDSVRAARSPSR